MNEYWRNPQIKFIQPTDKLIVTDPHCLFYDPKVPVESIEHQTLNELCTWANENIEEYGLESFYSTERNFYDLANLVKFNMWIKDIRAQGIVKPMLLTYTGNWIYNTNTGESRLRCLEIIPHIKTVTAFITTHQQYADRFSHLIEIKRAEQLFEICDTPTGTEYWFKFTDQDAPYGIEWFEYSSEKTSSCMLPDDKCILSIQNYLKSHRSVEFSLDWFSQEVDWSHYENC
tara:strand:+ start:1807 stop:2496 length:690 start_codon:yes stop_codon:yes gene_type:complete